MLPREYFPDHELRCHCGCNLLPPIESVERLYVLRMILRKPLPISSAARCWKQNRAAKGKAGSIHLPIPSRQGAARMWGGGAFDIIANADFQMEILRVALMVGFVGIGLADTFIHLDDAARGKLTQWRYK